MVNFAVLHTTKLGSGSGGIGSHIDRTQKELPKNVNPKRVHLNKEYIETKGSLYQDIEKRIKEGYNHRKKDGTLRAIRKDAVKAVGVILTGSHLKMKELEKTGQLEAWAKKNLEFMQKKVGKENIVRFSLHMDEKTPHVHCVFVPLDNDAKLNAKEIVGNKSKLTKLQNDYAAEMQQFGLNRGLKNTRVKHKTTRQYYAEIENAAEKAEIDTVLGIPKSGELERVQELARALQDEIIKKEKELSRLNNLERERRKSFNEAKDKMKDYKIKLDNKAKEVISKNENIETIIQNRRNVSLTKEIEKVKKEKEVYLKNTWSKVVNVVNTKLEKENLKYRLKLDFTKNTISMIDISKTQKLDFDQEENKLKKSRGRSV